MQLSRPSPDSQDFADLTLPQRANLQKWLTAFEGASQWSCVGTALKQIAKTMGVSYSTARRKYDALKASGGDWRSISDGRNNPITNSNTGTSNREFRNFLTSLAEKHHRSSKAAWRKFKQAWQNREQIPGYEDLPGWPELPFSDRTFYRILQKETDRRKYQSIRVSTSSKSNQGLAQVFTTREGLYPGAVYQVDDVWHDNWVTIGRNPKPTRVLEIGWLDLYSACRFQYGCKPRMKQEDGRMENLRQSDMRFSIAALLWSHGVSKRGTRIMFEHGAAGIDSHTREVLESSDLPIQLDFQPIEGKQAALTGFWKGTEGGNFRAKAALESAHNLIHNDLAHLALQTGSPLTGIHAPVTTDRQLSYISSIIKSVLEKVPHRAELLRLPSVDFHTQFLPLLNDYYQFGLNGRTDHKLEGWEKLGFLTTEYRLAPQSNDWLTSQDFLALPDSSQFLIRELAKNQPQIYSRRRSLSPMEVWNTRRDFERATPPLICDILGEDLGREVRVKGAYIRFHDLDIAPDELIYAARVQHFNGAQRELRDGEKFLAFANPFAPECLFLLDANKRYLGHCLLEQRVTATDRASLINAAGFKAQRNADIHAPLNVRHAEQVNEAKELRHHNKRVENNQAVTPEEHSAMRSEAGKKASRTAAANRLQRRGKAIDWDKPEPLTPAKSDDYFSTLPEDEEIPDSI